MIKSDKSTEILEKHKRLTAEGWQVFKNGVTCCICGSVIPTVCTPEGVATLIGRKNPAPLVNDGAPCCATCNERYVIPARIAQLDGSVSVLLALADRMRANDCTPMAVQGALDLADAATIAEG